MSKGSSGVEGQSIKDFEQEIGKNLYKLWNRLSSGSNHPPAVKVVSIPKAEEVMESIGRRLETLGMSLHPEKTKLVYCGRHYKGMKINEEISFDFLGDTYRPRGAKGKAGNIFTGFLPAVSSRSKRAISRRIRKWNLDKRSDKSLQELAKEYNPIIRGWMNYYCSYYPSAFSIILRRINRVLVKWVRRTLKSMRKKF